MNQAFTLQAIGHINTPFSVKFAIPRQAGLIDIPATIEFYEPFDKPQAFVGLEGVSHVWVSFIFHQHQDRQKKISVRPPRLGGNQHCGVFATRSSFRPNDIGLSLLKLTAVKQHENKVSLQVTGADMLDKTPVIDIKPYLPYADSIATASNALASEKPELNSLSVDWTDEARQQLVAAYDGAELANQQQLIITQLIALDPRPAYKQAEASGDYGFCYDGLNIQWRCQHQNAYVYCISNKP